jgi:hypothetical protein
MASTYSDRLKLELMETGANANTWGNNTNTNLETLDAFNAGYLSKSVAGSANVTLTTNNADPTAESSNKVIEFTGTFTGDITVFIPAVENNYIFFNNTSGSFTLTVAPTGHGSNGSVITQGAHTVQYCTGDTVVDLFANSLGTVSIKDTLNVTNTVNVAGNVTISSNGVVNATSFTGNGAGLTGVDPFTSGTKMVFYQASAPTGWTQDTASALSNTVMSVVTGTGGGTGGSTSYFSSFLATTDKSGTDTAPVTGSVSGTVGGHSLSTPEIASHKHQITQVAPGPQNPSPTRGFDAPVFQARRSEPTAFSFSEPSSFPLQGGGGSHAHPFSGSLASATADVSVTVPAANVKYANVIVATKD